MNSHLIPWRARTRLPWAQISPWAGADRIGFEVRRDARHGAPRHVASAFRPAIAAAEGGFAFDIVLDGPRVTFFE